MKKVIPTVLLQINFFAFSVSAQDNVTKIENETNTAVSTNGASANHEKQPGTTNSSTDIEKLKEELRKEMRQEIAENKRRIDKLEAQQEAAEMEAALEAIQAEADFNKLLRVYGFFDLTFFRFIMDEQSAYKNYLHDDVSTFMMSNINLYFDSQMTEILSALIELRFTFSPNGGLVNSEIAGVPGVILERQPLTFTDPFVAQFGRVNGVIIERAYMTYSPLEWFNIRAGRYLTPYGIWNVDHASTVVLPTHMPYLHSRQYMPPAQTGLQLFGRFFPLRRTFFDYAFTLSNGRGPIDEFIDLDENKALGLKLKFTFQTDNFSIAWGGYGYIGDYSDTKAVQHIYGVDPEVTIEEPVKRETVTTLKYKEYIVSTDLLIKLFGFKLQAEYVWQRTKMEVNPLRNEAEALLDTGSLLAEVYMPSYIGTAAYGLLSYRLPLDRFIGEKSLTPYILAELMSTNDTSAYSRQMFYIGGLNFAPSRFITLKVEGALVRPLHDVLGSGIEYVAGQIAVSF